MTTDPRKQALGAEELQLLASIKAIAEAIATQASALPPAEAESFIEAELAKTAAAMKKYEGKGPTPATSVGFAIDRCLRERIALLLAQRPK